MLSCGADISGASKNHVRIDLNIGYRTKVWLNFGQHSVEHLAHASVPNAAAVYVSEMSM